MTFSALLTPCVGIPEVIVESHPPQSISNAQFFSFIPCCETVLAQIAKFIGPTWGPSGSCRPQMGPMWVPWILLLGSCQTSSQVTGDLWSRGVLAKRYNASKQVLYNEYMYYVIIKCRRYVLVFWRALVTSLITRFMGVNMGPMWGRQDPGGPHVGPMNKTIHWLIILSENSNKRRSWLYVTKLCA